MTCKRVSLGEALAVITELGRGRQGKYLLGDWIVDIQERLMKRIQDLKEGRVSKEDVKQSLIRAGILDKDGKMIIRLNLDKGT